MSELDRSIDEQDIIDSVEQGEWKQVDNFEQAKTKFELAARQTSQKDFRINIRVSSRDVELLKSIAMEEGIPYQTLVSSILHKYVTGRLTEKNRS
jgi:predicted DNA binding CopG/RHH family protein